MLTSSWFEQAMRRSVPQPGQTPACSSTGGLEPFPDDHDVQFVLHLGGPFLALHDGDVMPFLQAGSDAEPDLSAPTTTIFKPDTPREGLPDFA